MCFARVLSSACETFELNFFVLLSCTVRRRYLLFISKLWFYASWVVYADEWLSGFFWLSWMRSGLFKGVGWGRAFFFVFGTGLNGDGVFEWVGWGRGFRMGWMRTGYSTGLNGVGFFIWVKWGLTFSSGLDGDWLFLFHLGWMRTAFSNENSFLKWE